MTTTKRVPGAERLWMTARGDALTVGWTFLERLNDHLYDGMVCCN